MNKFSKYFSLVNNVKERTFIQLKRMKKDKKCKYLLIPWPD